MSYTVQFYSVSESQFLVITKNATSTSELVGNLFNAYYYYDYEYAVNCDV